jgi:L-alanine-DL-glutamate epimerase-like enolase superfamily enzyme
LEVIQKAFEQFGDTLRFRVDMNQGYSLADLQFFLHKTKQLPLELIEQPLPLAMDKHLLQLSSWERILLTADESIQTVEDAYRLLAEERTAYSLFNIKLMKCGGPTAARQIADLAQLGGKTLMWGCMDESCIGISAALNSAYSCANTRYIDLDGSFDLAYDLARGGFTLEGGIMRPLHQPGLGVDWDE